MRAERDLKDSMARTDQGHMNQGERRKKKLIEPRVQWRFVRTFLTTAGLAVLVQAPVVSYLTLRVADGLPNDGVELKSQLLEVLASSLLVTTLVLVPLTLGVGITSTHKIVGPMYRFRVYLTELVAGTATRPCRIRDDDELQDLCALLNRATESLRPPEAATTTVATGAPVPAQREAA